MPTLIHFTKVFQNILNMYSNLTIKGQNISQNQSEEHEILKKNSLKADMDVVESLYVAIETENYLLKHNKLKTEYDVSLGF